VYSYTALSGLFCNRAVELVLTVGCRLSNLMLHYALLHVDYILYTFCALRVVLYWWTRANN